MLTIVGTGIESAGQLTAAARTAIEQADKLLYMVAEPLAKALLHRLKPTAESLSRHYGEGKDRLETYKAMADRIVEEASRGANVCAAFYGHPGVFVLPAHEAIRRAREAGIPATMLPAVSAEDCLFADLGIDPGLPGCQSFEGTDFLIHRRQFDVTSSLILWQIGAIGMQTCELQAYAPRNLAVLADYLAGFYGADHRVVVYEASTDPARGCRAERTTLAALPEAAVSIISTLYVGPKHARAADPDMIRRLGMTEEDVRSMETKLELLMQSIRAASG